MVMTLGLSIVMTVAAMQWIVQIAPNTPVGIYVSAVLVGAVWSALTAPVVILSTRVGLLRYYRTALLNGWVFCGVVLLVLAHDTLPTLADGTPYLISATPSEMANLARLIGFGWAALTAPMVVSGVRVALTRYRKSAIVGGWLLCGAVLWVVGPQITVRPEFLLHSYPIVFPIVAIISSALARDQSIAPAEMPS